MNLSENFDCAVCDKSLPTLKELGIHYATHFEIKDSSVTSSRRKNEKKYTAKNAYLANRNKQNVLK